MNSVRIKVEGEEGLYRDGNSMGIVSDDTAYARYKAEREKKLKAVTQEMKINNLERDVADLKGKMDEILSILRGK